jgi:hypothetical protein
MARLKTSPSSLSYREAVSLLDETMAKMSQPSAPTRSELRPRALIPAEATDDEFKTGND